MTREDQKHFEAAEGWLGLGDWYEASGELEQLSPCMRAHPDVLRLRWQVYAGAGKWELAAEVGRAICERVPDSPFGYVHMAHALHKMERTKQAHAVLLPVVDKFPDDYTMSYNLARYACQLGDLKGSMAWLEKAIDLAGKKDIREMALVDPDLEPLWANISEV